MGGYGSGGEWSRKAVVEGCGVRWWFTCPLSRGGAACGRRVRKLYLSGRYFGCRHCHGLTYHSRQESDARVYALARAGLDARGLRGYARESADRFRDVVRGESEETAEELARRSAARRRGRSRGPAPGRRAGPKAGRGAASLGRDERIAKYERHLHSLLTSTLYEPLRLQARRDGEPVAPPAVADVNVTVDSV